MATNRPTNEVEEEESSILEELRAERDVLKEALQEFYTKLSELTSVYRLDEEEMVSEIKELCIIVEPILIEIKEMDLKIQAELKRLKLRDDLVNEIKTSRVYGAKIQVILNKAKNLECNFYKELGLNRSEQNKRDSEKPAEPRAERNSSPGFLFSNFPGADWRSEGEGNERFQNRTPLSSGKPNNVNSGAQAQPEASRVFESERCPEITETGHFPGQLNANAQPFVGYNPFYGGGIGWNHGNSAYNPLGNQSNIKLPKLELKHFSGDPMKWLEFWDSFERNVHENKSYSEVHKLSYLKACLDGAASTTIANLKIIGENYKPAVEVLKAKYGRVVF